MWIKYQVLSGDCTIALKHNFRTGKGIIGGWLGDKHIIERILEIYFVKKTYKGIFNSANKVRYEFKLSDKVFRKKVEDMQKDDFIVQQVPRHGRLMT